MKKGDEATKDLRDKRSAKQGELNTLELEVVGHDEAVLEQDGKIRGFEGENKRLKDENDELSRKKKEVMRRKDLLPKNEKEIELLSRQIADVSANQKLAGELPSQIAQATRDLESAKKGDTKKRLNELTIKRKELNDNIRTKGKTLGAIKQVEARKLELAEVEKDIVAINTGTTVSVDPTLVKDLEDKIADLQAQQRALKDKNSYGQELKRLNDQLARLEADKHSDEKYIFDSIEPKELIKNIQSDIDANEKKIIDNMTEIKKVEKSRLDSKKKSTEAQLKIKELTQQLRDLDQQISSKSPDDKSRVDYNNEKAILEGQIAKSTKEKTILEGKIKKQEEKNKVHRTIRKRGNRVQATATQLQAIQTGTLTPDAQRKEIMKLMKNIDLSFTKAPESKGKFDFNSLTEAQKAQIAAILNPTA